MVNKSYSLLIILFLIAGCAIDNELQGDFTPGNSVSDPSSDQNIQAGDFHLVSAGQVNAQTSGGYSLNLSLGNQSKSQQVTGGGYTVDLSVVGRVQ